MIEQGGDYGNAQSGGNRAGDGSWSGVTLVQNNCGNEATSPKIGGTAIVSPSALIGLGGGWFWPGEYIS
jgi:hypothetical protein